MPQLFKRCSVRIKYCIGLRKSLHRSLDTFLAQQMQYRKRRAVGVVADVIRLRAIKLKLRVKAGQLDHAFQPMLIDHAFSYF